MLRDEQQSELLICTGTLCFS